MLISALLPTINAWASWNALSPPLGEGWGNILELAANRKTRDGFVVFTTKGIALSTDGGYSFEFRSNGFGEVFNAVVQDLENPMWFWASGRSSLWRSRDFGFSWEPAKRLAIDGDMDYWLIKAAFAERGLLFAFRIEGYVSGTDAFYMELSTDEGRSWNPTTYVMGERGSLEIGLTNDDFYVLTVGMGGYESTLLTSTDAGVSWRFPTFPIKNPVSDCMQLTLGGPERDQLYLAYGYGAKTLYLYRSTDAGETWASAEGNLAHYGIELEKVRWVLCLGNGELLYVNDNHRLPVTTPVKRSRDGGGTWLPASWGYPAAAVPKSNMVSPWWSPGSAFRLISTPDTGLRLYRWEPSNEPPVIVMGGWSPDHISSAVGATVSISAYVVDPNDDQVSVELLYQGMPTGVILEDAGNGYYAIDVPIGPGQIQPGYYMLELCATDAAGTKSMVWPYVESEGRSEASGYAAVVPPFLASGYDSQSRPSIACAGWCFTGTLGSDWNLANLAAFVSGPSGPDETNVVELCWQGMGTGVFLRQNYLGDFSEYEGIYGYSFFDTSDYPPGSYYVELQARDANGNSSGLWPYLEVEP